MNRLIILFVTLLYSGLSFAGSATGKVTTVFVADGSPSVLFVLNTQINNTPRCNEEGRFSLALNKPGGMAAYMAILEAKKQGYDVHVEGTNTCTNEWKSEDIKNITIK
jgi:hypothetical protein